MCPLTTPAPAWATSTGLLLVRLVVGAAFILHGWPKIQNPTGWMNEMPGMTPPPGAVQAIPAVFEFAGGILLAAGLVTRGAALALVSVMIGALALYHIPQGHPFVAMKGSSSELASVYLVVNLLLAATGPGMFSLDALLFDRCCATPSHTSDTAHPAP